MAMVILGPQQAVCIPKSTQQHAMECPPIAFTSPVGDLWGSGRAFGLPVGWRTILGLAIAKISFKKMKFDFNLDFSPDLHRLHKRQAKTQTEKDRKEKENGATGVPARRTTNLIPMPSHHALAQFLERILRAAPGHAVVAQRQHHRANQRVLKHYRADGMQQEVVRRN